MARKLKSDRLLFIATVGLVCASLVMDALVPRKDIADKISQIDVHDAHDAIVLLRNDPALLHLGEERFLERLRGYVDLAEALHDRVPDMKRSFFRAEFEKGLREEWTMPPKREQENRKFLPVLS